jgi:hypothetical protein
VVKILLVRNHGIVTIRRIFLLQIAKSHPPITMTVAVHGKNGINGECAGNYHLMDEESSRHIDILPGITSSGTKNLQDDY